MPGGRASGVGGAQAGGSDGAGGVSGDEASGVGGAQEVRASGGRGAREVGVSGGRGAREVGVSGGRGAREVGVSGGRGAREVGVSGGRGAREAGVSGGHGAQEAGASGGRGVQQPGGASRGGVHEVGCSGGAAQPRGGGVGPGAEERSRGKRAPRPAQLPPPPGHFTGRGDVVRALRHGLTGDRSFAVVSGMAGVGKSALALHVAHGLRDEFPDGQLYVNLRGATPGMTPLTPASALASLLRDLGAEPRRAPEDDEDPAAASALLRSLLAPTRTLMVLDDAATAAQVRPLLPAGPGCAVIVTSRSPLTALDGADRFPLEPLSDRDSAALLRAVSGRDGLDAGHPLVRLAGRLPLALRIVAARLAARHALTPDALAELLTVSGGRLHHLEYDDLSVRCSLSVALDALRTSDREADRDAALVLARIGALDLPTYGVPLIARLLDADELRAGAALDRLVDVALLEETAYGRYAPHDLVRDFAREVSGAGAGAEDAVAAVDRVAETALRWYAESARRSLLAIIPEGLDRADRLRGVAARLGDVSSSAPMSTSAPMSMEAAFAWGDTELDNIVALAERHHDTSALMSVLVRCLFPYLQRRGRLTELAALGAVAVAAARRQGDTADEAQALTDLAGMHYMSGRASEALALNDEALALWRELGFVSCVRRGLNNRGLLLEGLDRHEESADALHQSLALAKELADPLSEAVTLSHLGNLYEHTDARAAIAHHEQSLAIGETIGHAIVRQSAHCNIGYAHLTLGEPAAALAHLEESLRIHDEYEDWHGASQSRLGLARALRELGRHEDAARECAVLLDRAEQRGDTHMAGLARHQHGLLLAAAGRREEAYEQWESALSALDGTDSKVTDELRGLLGAP
ncbi:hypothetical protein CP970_19395 [Streptomyces kanamyceticus]|uniref:NB-ARC domain-containing protein n=1 Tax=Streptomyces kanamyceticus TaxID=1967 RepID=A0A5J6GUJ6_STRKN|nr:hypothetical protein CP970_19395 [Streptomyces kanamyceticus]